MQNKEKERTHIENPIDFTLIFLWQIFNDIRIFVYIISCQTHFGILYIRAYKKHI